MLVLLYGTTYRTKLLLKKGQLTQLFRIKNCFLILLYAAQEADLIITILHSGNYLYFKHYLKCLK